MIGTPNVFHKPTKLLTQCHQDLILILDRF